MIQKEPNSNSRILFTKYIHGGKKETRKYKSAKKITEFKNFIFYNFLNKIFNIFVIEFFYVIYKVIFL